MRLPSITLGACLAAVAFGCGGEVPSAPTYFADVQPILAANCGRCHGADPLVDSISSFRLDRYVKNDDLTQDVWDYQELIVAQASDLLAPAMPLDYVLTDRQRDILRRWVANGAPKGTRDNKAPEIELTSPSEARVVVDQSLSLSFRSWDDDGDGLLVSIGVRPVGSTGGDIVASGFGGGARTTEIDVGLLASMQTFEVFAVVDDGFSDNPADNATEFMLIRELFVDHGVRGTAPRVALLQPNGGATVIGMTTITWTASDPDPGDVLSITLDLLEVDGAGNIIAVTPLAAGLANDTPSFEWDVSAVPTTGSNGAPIFYRVRVTAADTDAKNIRSDESDDSFTIAEETGATDTTWADVKPIFVTYCGKCHKQPARTPALEYFRLDKYDAADPEAPTNGDDGVFEQRSLVYDRLVVKGSMPPTAEPQPSAAEVQLIAAWILGGAPKESGPVDGVPTFSWTTPNGAAITKVSTPDVTLTWNASDPEALPFMASQIDVAQISAVADAQANCNASTTGWTAVAGIDVTTGSFAWTAPSQGYFCFRGTVTDAAGQTATSIAGRPVKYSTVGPPGG